MELEDKFKFLGKFIRYDLKEKQQEVVVRENFPNRLKIIDQDLANGIMKSWLFQFSVIPSLAWPFQVYDFPLNFAKKLDIVANRYLKGWLGLHKKADVGVLYRSRASHGLGLTCPSLLLTQLQLVKLQLIKYSKEGPEGQLANLYSRRLEREKKFTRRWKPGPTLEAAEAKLSFEIKFAGQTDRKGLGNNRYNYNPTPQARRKRISLGLAHDHDRKAELHSMTLSQQGGWTVWSKNVHPYHLSWKDLIFLKNPKIFSHLINATINCLPSPSRLHRWGFITSPACPLCDKNICTLRHIFSNCKTALTQGRYSWRHDSVLKCLEPTLLMHSKDNNEIKSPSKLINFVKAGVKGSSASPSLSSTSLVKPEIGNA